MIVSPSYRSMSSDSCTSMIDHRCLSLEMLPECRYSSLLFKRRVFYIFSLFLALLHSVFPCSHLHLSSLFRIFVLFSFSFYSTCLFLFFVLQMLHQHFRQHVEIFLTCKSLVSLTLALSLACHRMPSLSLFTPSKA